MRLRPIAHLENRRPKCTQERQLTRFLYFAIDLQRKPNRTDGFSKPNRTSEKFIPHIPNICIHTAPHTMPKSFGLSREGKYIPRGVICAEFLWLNALPVANQCYRHPLDLILSSTTNRLVSEGPSLFTSALRCHYPVVITTIKFTTGNIQVTRTEKQCIQNRQ